MALDFNKTEESSIIGFPIRKKLTDYTSNQLKELLYSFDNVARKICNKKFSKERYDEKFTFVYGKENNRGDVPSIDFILQEAILSYGCYEHYTVEINYFGIFVSFRESPYPEEELLSIYWIEYDNFKKLNLELLP